VLEAHPETDMTATPDLRRVFEAQQARRWALKTSTADERRERLSRLRAAVVGHTDEVVQALYDDLRRPPAEAPDEIAAVTREIDRALDHLDEWMAPTPVTASFPGTTAFVQHEARGVVLLFGPWNFPFGLLLQPLAAIVAAGNTAIVKPNELALATSAVATTIIREAFSEEEVAVFEGGVELANELLELPVDHIFFTGSPAVGRTVMTAAARHLASVTLELGGKCPVIIDATVDLARVAALVAIGKTSNAGQICLSPDHVYVPSDLREEFVELYLGAVESRVYADGSIDLSAMARMIDRRNFDRVAGYIDDAVARGAKLVGSGARDAGTLTIEPVILLDVPADAAVMQDEIFGPVLPVFGYDELQDVVDAVRGRPKPLAVWAFTEDRETQAAILAGTSSGGTTINGWATNVAEPHLPFGGVGQSGMGAYHGRFGFHELSHARAVVRHEAL
jgi:aldehyde dehydrogenase (NAD+)